MAAGMPVIVTPNCGGPDIVSEGTDGFVIPVGDSDIIVERLLHLQENPSLLNQMGKNAITKAHEFTWDKYEALSQALKKWYK